VQVEEVPLSQIAPYKKNPRKFKHSEAVQRLAGIIQSVGFLQPIVTDENYVILAGHTRLAAAQYLKLDTAPVHVVSDLTEAQKVAWRIADNRSNEFTEFAPDLLAGEMLALHELNIDIDLTGFTQEELTTLLQGDEPEPEAETDAGSAKAKNSISFTTEQYEAVTRAIYRLREMEQQDDIPEGRAIELICADWCS
jgi:ParB-like chromosome segregation protein Spo0J